MQSQELLASKKVLLCEKNSTCATTYGSGVCVFYNQDTHHMWDAPYDDHGCAESIEGDGVSAVLLTTTAGGKAGICAPRARDGKCFAQDYPEDAGPTPKAVVDENEDQVHCLLECNDKVCMDGSHCTPTIETFRTKYNKLRRQV